MVSETIKLKRLYKGLGWPSFFSRFKFYFAPLERIEPFIIKDGFIVDLGCGYGVFANMLGLGSSRRKIIGFDSDENKIKFANRGLSNVECKVGDITKIEIPPADCIILIHVLHHLPSYKDQEKLLERCSVALNSGGSLVITEVDYKPWWKFVFCFLADHILYSRDIITFRSSLDFLELFRLFSFQVKIFSMHQGTLFSHVTYVCRKIEI